MRLLLSFYIFWVVLKRVRKVMKTNFIPSFPISKREQEERSRRIQTMQVRGIGNGKEEIERIEVAERHGQLSKVESILCGHVSMKGLDDCEKSDPTSSCTSTQMATKVSKYQQNSRRQQRLHSPKQHSALSPPTSQPNTSPDLKGSHFAAATFLPVRSTLKNLLHGKITCNKAEQIYKEKQGLNGSYRANRTVTNLGCSPMKSIEKQNQILRQENEMLRRELSEIKKNLMFGSSGKKEDIICNLRDTIKKEDSENKELRFKLQINTKKLAALNTLLQSKDQQIVFLSSKLQQSQQQLAELNYRNQSKIQKLKDKIAIVFGNFADLQSKFIKAEMQWQGLKQRWEQERGIYLHRISFLEQYIADN